MLKEFKRIIGDPVYNAYLSTLKVIGPDARTHRISVVIAAMLRYALRMLPEQCEKDSLGAALITLDEGADRSDGYRRVADLIEELCREAGMCNRRQSARGDQYSIADNVIAEHCAWYNMPWEEY